ncbi:HutD family protein [Streptomyces sp. NPDC007189]|uniref:HutD/Ves family protein n=1 Tax=Streptomyces sp. NPDC007189 TaxID=3154315 RepID=UPI00345138EE
MSSNQILRAAERTVTPWKNGGGLTREVAVSPSGAGVADFDWRLSMADVAQGGPFSCFPGVDRVIMVVEGPGMALTVDGTEHLVGQRFRPFAFPGDAVTQCRLLGGPLVDFNVMTRRDRVRAEVSVGREAAEMPVGALALVLDGSAELDGERLGRLDAVLAGLGGTLRVDGVAAVLRFHPV